MELFNLLSDVQISLYGQTYDVYLNWIGTLIKWLITGIGSVGVGIILFSLILKLIVLPFDIYQRVAMRKQNIKMKENQAKMEKLQKQYANDKDMYNQKLMEMYKESGFSMFSSCLPMILSLVIFFVAINAFNAYSQYSNIENYNIMVNAYNAKLESYCADLEEENITVDGDKILVKDDAEGKYIYYTVAYVENYAENDYAYIKSAEKDYRIDEAKVEGDISALTGLSEAIETAKAGVSTEETDYAARVEAAKKEAISDYFIGLAQDEVLVAYQTKVSQNTHFLWIKNIWATDASYKHPVLEYSDFQTEVSREKFYVGNEKVSFNDIEQKGNTNAYKDYAYEKITAKLSTQKSEANGWYILIVLSIGTILLQQFVTMRSQKEQQKYSSVDGQGASQQKMTMVIMTVMFAFFAFMYSAAFSIYMIMSNLFSMVSTLIINKVVDEVERKKEEKALKEKYNKRFPKVSKESDKKSKK